MAKKAATATAAESAKSNSDIVREILDSGVLKPAEIEQVARDKYKKGINKGLINQVKVTWKKKKGTSAVKASKRTKPVLKRTKVVRNAIVDAGPGIVGNGRPSELDVAKFALKMGGIDKAIQALQDLAK